MHGFINGHQIGSTIYSSSLKHCQASCDANPACESIDFSPSLHNKSWCNLRNCSFNDGECDPASSTTGFNSYTCEQRHHEVQSDGTFEYDWPGVSFNIGVTGTYLKATFDTSKTDASTHTKLRVFLTDGGYPLPANEISLHPLMKDYLLAAGLSGGTRTLSVYNNQSPSYMKGSIKLVSLSTDGKFTEPQLAPTMKSRRLEFIGDSITAGE
jgi:hypothetical protein